MGIGVVLSLCCLAATPVISHGTAIAAIRVPAELVIAADSRVVDGLNRRLPDECKIRVIHDTAFTAHGISTDSETGLDLFRIVSSILRGRGDLAVAVANVAANVAGPLSEALERTRRAEPGTFQRNAIQMAAAGVILGRHERGAPHLGYVRFAVRIEPDDGLRVDAQVQMCPSADCPDGVVGLFVAPHADANAFQRAHPEYWKQDLVAIATAFVQGEIDKNLVDIGPPIDVVRIAGGHVSWVRRKAGCLESE